jgi:hypothetical protein
MTINLRPEHERLVAQAMENGGYKSPDEVVGRALEIFSLDNEWFRDNADVVHDKIERAFDQFDWIWRDANWSGTPASSADDAISPCRSRVGPSF